MPADPTKTTISIPDQEEIFSSADQTPAQSVSTPQPPPPPPPPPTPQELEEPISPQLPQEESTSSGPPPPPQELIIQDQGPTSGPKSLLIKILIPLALIIILILAFKLISALVSRLKAPSPLSQAKITLNYWGLWEPVEVLQPLIQEFQNSHPNITINYQKQHHQQYYQKLQYELPKETAPDIFRLHNTWVSLFKTNLSPMPEEVKKSLNPNSAFYPVHNQDLSIGGQYYALPLEIDGLGLFINNEIFQNAGKSPPTTWDEFRQTATDLTVKDEAGKIKIAGAALGTTTNIDHWPDVLGVMMLQNGVEFQKLTQYPKLAEDALSYFTLFTRFDKVWDDTLPHSTAAFATGKLAMYFGPSWEAIDIHNLNPDLDFRIVPIPQLPDEDAPNKTTNINWASYWVEGVNKNSKNSQAAWEFLAFLAQKQILEKFFQNAVASGRLFGEPYPRLDMATLLDSHQYLGTYIRQASTSQSWYLCSRTWDEGLNDNLIEYLSQAVNSINQGQAPTKAVQDFNQGITQVLSQYGLASASAPNN